MKNLFSRYLQIHNKTYYLKLLLGVLFFGFSLLATYYGNSFVSVHASRPVSDIILDNIKVYDVDGTFLWGVVLFIACILYLGFSHPKRIPYLLSTSALFMTIRSFFIILTHIAAPIEHSAVYTNNIFERLIAGSGADLFFSGHTGFPFLMALIFWEHKIARNIFLSMSVIFAIAVLAGHLHYSIDVFSAFFITYTISHIAERLFKKEHALFNLAE